MKDATCARDVICVINWFKENIFMLYNRGVTVDSLYGERCLAYLSQGLCLARTGKPLFANNIFVRDDPRIVFDRTNRYEKIELFSEDEENVMSDILLFFGNNFARIYKATIQKGGPVHRTVYEDKKIIPLEYMKEYFTQNGIAHEEAVKEYMRRMREVGKIFPFDF